MSTLRSVTKLNMRCVILLSVLFLSISTFVIAQPATIDQAKKAKIDTTIRIATVWLDRGNYQQARSQLDSLTMSEEFKAYISDSQQKQINDIMKQISIALEERSKISQVLQQSDVLATQGNYKEAMEILAEVKDSQYASEQERQMLRDSYNSISEKYAAQQKSQKWQSLYEASLAHYNEGRLDLARQGFEQIADAGVVVEGPNTPQQYIEMIDAKKQQQNQMSSAVEELVPLVEGDATAETVAVPAEEPTAAITEQPVPEQSVDSSVNEDIDAIDLLEMEVGKQAAEQASQQQQGPEATYLDIIRDKRAAQISYTTAVVKDAIEKAQAALSTQQFDKARESLRRAFSIVEKNKMLLGDVLYSDYSAQLTNLDQKVNEAQQQYAQQQETDRQKQADQLNQEIRQTMDQEREQAVEDYMERTFAFMKEQRYEEALGQLEQLLAIDPLNQRALILKEQLSRNVLYIEQQKLDEEADRQEISVMMKAREISIPYSDEITYPHNWKEISEKREAALKKEMAPADLAVNTLLNKTVDLSMLTEDTTLEDAIGILSESVDPQLPIVVYWPDLSQNAFIEKDTVIGISGDALRSIALKDALERILESVSSGGFAEVGYVVQGGSVTVATVDALPDNYVTEIYDVADLLNPPANFGEGGGSNNSNGGGNNNNGGGMGGGMGGGGMMGGMGGGGMMGGMGGGMMGGMGGMGGGGMMGGMGGMGGGMMGGGSVGNWRSMIRGYMLINLIQQTVAPETWYAEGGEGRVDQYSERKLIIYQTPEVHQEINKLLEKLREGLGEQVAIEARFLTVTENFLEDIGLDIQNLNVDLFGFELAADGDGTVNQYSYEHTAQSSTGIGGTWGGVIGNSNPSLAAQFSYTKLDDLEVTFLLRATQAHKNSKQLSAPKATVLNGESARMEVQTTRSVVTNVDLGTETITPDTGAPITYVTVDRTIDDIDTGIELNITPVISADKKYVILRITAYLDEAISDTTFTTELPVGDGVVSENYTLPTTQTTSIETRANVPDKGTLLLGGLTLTASREIESGAPFLSKLPLLGRFFSNRSDIDDKQMLLILVKPTILLQEESEADAIGALANK